MLLRPSLSQSFSKCHPSLYSDFRQMQLTVAGRVFSSPLFDIQLPWCINARSSSRQSGKCCSTFTAIQSGIVSVRYTRLPNTTLIDFVILKSVTKE